MNRIYVETIQDVAEGLSDKAIASRRHISLRAVQRRIQQAYFNLSPDHGNEQKPYKPYSTRNRVVFLAVKSGLITI